MHPNQKERGLPQQGMTMTEDWKRLLDAVASTNPIIAAFDVCHEIAKREVDSPILTATFQDVEAKTVSRIYSSRQQSWAIGGTKPLSVGKWSETVIERREPFIANSFADMKEVFNDWEISEGLGLGAIVNVPIFYRGEVLGTANVLNVPGAYSNRAVVERVLALAPFFTMAMLTAA